LAQWLSAFGHAHKIPAMHIDSLSAALAFRSMSSPSLPIALPEISPPETT